MNIRNLVLCSIVLSGVTKISANSIVKYVVGDQAPYFFGVLADDAAYAFNAGKKEVYGLAKDANTATKSFASWCKSNKGIAAWLLRIGYQASKVGVGVAVTFGASENEFGNKYYQNYAGCGGGLALAAHGVRGIIRECGFEGFRSLFGYLEGNKS